MINAMRPSCGVRLSRSYILSKRIWLKVSLPVSGSHTILVLAYRAIGPTKRYSNMPTETPNLGKNRDFRPISALTSITAGPSRVVNISIFDGYKLQHLYGDC